MRTLPVISLKVVLFFMNLGNTFTENPAIGDQPRGKSFSLRGKPQGARKPQYSRHWIFKPLISNPKIQNSRLFLSSSRNNQCKAVHTPRFTGCKISTKTKKSRNQ